jgi:allophanate hydrolase subunit 1
MNAHACSVSIAGCISAVYSLSPVSGFTGLGDLFVQANFFSPQNHLSFVLNGLFDDLSATFIKPLLVTFCI